MADTPDPGAKAITAISGVNPDASEFSVVFVHPEFLDGRLYVVRFKENSQFRENYVYIKGNELHVNKNNSHLVEMVARKSRRRTAIELFLNVGGIAGVIGILITLTLCYMFAFKQVERVPEVLSTALTTILGFYFGTKTQGRTA